MGFFEYGLGGDRGLWGILEGFSVEFGVPVTQNRPVMGRGWTKKDRAT
jgi:hypothetical protein